MILICSRIVSRGWELDQAGLLPQGAQMLREYHGMMDGDRGRRLALMPLIFRMNQESERKRGENLAKGLKHSWCRLNLLREKRRPGENSE